MIENGERLVSAVSFVDVALLVDAIEAHAGDAHDEAAVLVEGHARAVGRRHARRLPCLTVIGREEADDLALPDAAIEIVVLVENDVFGTVDLAEADDLDVAKAVVHRVGRRRSGGEGRRAAAAPDRPATHRPWRADCAAICPSARRWRSRTAAPSRPPSTTRRSASPSLTSPLVNSETMIAPIRALPIEPRPPPTLLPPSSAAVTDRELEADAGVRAGAGKPRRVERAGEAGEQAGDDIGQAHRAPHGDAGVVGGATRSADRHDAPADAQPGQDDLRDDRRSTTRTSDAERRAQHRSGADKVPGRRLHVARSDLHGIDLQQQLDDRPNERQHDERGQERAQPQKADEQAVDQADQRADADGRRDGRCHRPFRDIDQRQTPSDWRARSSSRR